MKKTSLNTQILFGVLAGILLGMGFSVLGQESAVAQNGLYIAGLIGTLSEAALRSVFVVQFALIRILRQ